MSVRMRHTRAHSGNRRSHHALKGPRLTRDNKTNSIHLRHRVDTNTGMYRGRQVMDVAGSASDLVETPTKKATETAKEEK